jgi:hypothetical protein
MNYTIDCGYQSVGIVHFEHHSRIGFHGCAVKALGNNNYHVTINEVVKPAELAAVLNRVLDRSKPVGASFMDPVKVTVEEEEK